MAVGQKGSEREQKIGDREPEGAHRVAAIERDKHRHDIPEKHPAQYPEIVSLALKPDKQSSIHPKK
jgi:hypothetical protein